MTSMTAKTRLLGLLAAIVMTGAAVAAERIEIMPLRSRPATELLPIIKPLAGPGSTVTALGGRLIVKADEVQLAEIRALLAELDRPPRRLLIEVRRNWQGAISSSGANLDARLGTDSGGISLGNPRHTGVTARLHAAQTSRRADIAQRVQTLEGHAAYIMVGAEVPVRDTAIAVIGPIPVIHERTNYRNTTSGFYVVPQVHGDSVTLAIQQHADRPAVNQAFAVQRAGATVAGRLGEWIDLGGSTGAVERRDSGLGRHASTRRDSDLDLQLRVTEVD